MTELWTKNKMPMSWFIRWLFGECCSHYALQFSNGFVLHSNLFGVHPEWTKTFYSYQTIQHSVPHEIPQEIELQMFRYILDQYDSFGYDWAAIPFIVWRGLLRKFFKIPLPTKGNNSKGIFCHEMRLVFQESARIHGYKTKEISGDLSIVTPHGVFLKICKAMAGA